MAKWDRLWINARLATMRPGNWLCSLLLAAALEGTGLTHAAAQDRQRGKCLTYEGDCIFWSVRDMSFSADGRTLDFAYAFYRKRRLITPGAVARFDIETGNVTVTDVSCEMSYRAVAISPDGRWRGVFISSRPAPIVGGVQAKSSHWIRVEDLRSRGSKVFLAGNDREIQHIGFNNASSHLYVVRGLPRTGRAQFDRIQLSTGKVEGVYPVGERFEAPTMEDAKRQTQWNTPGFNSVSNFSFDVKDEHIAIVGWSLTNTAVVGELILRGVFDERYARTMHLVMKINIATRTARYHEVHDHPDFGRRWMRFAQYAGDALYFIPQAEWSDWTRTIYRFRDGWVSKHLEVNGIILQARLLPSGALLAYTRRDYSQEIDPYVELVIHNRSGRRVAVLEPEKLLEKLAAPLACKEYFRVQ